MSVRRSRLLQTAAVICSLGMSAGTAFAQQAGTVQEIVVTAQKRAERLQDVPASITAISSEQLAARGVTSTLDLAQSTPGLTFGNTGPWTNFYMRGVGNSIATPAAQAPVAMYIDGVYESDTAAMVFGLDNVERVEVLKGPQGTLYGRNAVGGAINVITLAPTSEPDLRLKITGGNLSDREISGYASGGNDLLQANLAVSRRLRDGYYKQVIQGAEDLDNLDNLALRGKIRATPNDRIELTLALDYSLQKGRGPGTTNLPFPAGSGVIPTGVLFGGIVPSESWRTSSLANLASHARDMGASLTGRFNFDNFSIVSITATRDFANTHGVDFDATNATVTEWRASDFHRQFSQELQILSPAAGRLSWIAGLYYLNEKAGFDPFHYNAFANLGGVFIDIFSKVRSESYAAYAEGTYKVTDHLSVVAGLRYSEDKSTHYDSRENVVLPAPPIIVAALNSSGNKHSWDAFTPRISLKYARPEGLYYVTASKGYSAGLYNIPNIAPTAALDNPIQPQKIEAVEAGAKWSLLDNRLRLNAAGFYYKLTSLQTFSIAGNGLTSFENANGKSEGFDADAVWAATPDLTLRAALEVLDTKYTSYPHASVWVLNPQQLNFAVQPCGGQAGATPFDAECQGSANLTGKPFMRSPTFTSTLGFDYDVPVLSAESGRLRLTGNWYHSNHFWVSVNGSIVSPGYNSFNANLTYTSPGDKWSAAIWGNNLSNAQYYVTGGDGNYGRVIQLAEPRTYGITLTYHYK